MDWYRGKKVFVTGGSSGIGREAATMLARSGASVVIGARDQRRLDIALGQIQGVGSGDDQVLAAEPIDVGDRESVQQATGRVLERLGGLDVLINNAGIAQPGYVHELPDSVFESMMRVNYFGTVNVTRALLPHFMKQRSGQITNVASIAGIMGIFGYTAYAPSKFAVVGFSEALRQELLSHGVGVSVVLPGDTDTPQLAEENKSKPPETLAVAGNVKVMSAEAVAEAMLAGSAVGRRYIVPGFDSKFTRFMYRHFPWMVHWVIDRDVRKAIRQA